MSPVKWRERKEWEAARTLGDLGQLMARWLEGDLKSNPSYHGKSDLDSAELTALCAALCRSGFLTWNSQQTGDWGSDIHGRTYIEGFAHDGTLKRIRGACEPAGVIVVAHPTPTRKWFSWLDGGPGIPVVLYGDQVRLSVGHQVPRDYVETCWGEVGVEAYADVLSAWQVTVVDPRWGDDRHLVRALGSLRGSVVRR